MRRPFWRKPADAAVDQEIAEHLELLTERYVARGMDPAAAREAAMQRFGDTAGIREACRELAQHMETDMRRADFLDGITRDLQFAVRTFRRAPLFAAVATITLALGIGANTAIFSVVNAVLLRPLPYDYADRTMVIWNQYAADALSKASIAAPEFADMRDGLRTVDVAALQWRAVNISGECTAQGGDCEAERVSVYVTSPNIFTLLGAQAAHGRAFREEDGALGAEPTILISDALWRRRFGGDPSIIDRRVLISGVGRRVIGVMPPGVRFPDAPVGFLKEPADLWLPFSWELARTGPRGNQNLSVIARLRGDATFDAAQSDLDRLAAGFRAQFPDRYANPQLGWRLAGVTLRDETVGDTKRGLLLLFGAVGLVLLVACANVANLMLARGASREREFAVRASLGAGQARLVRQLLTESAVLGAAGGVLGLGFAMISMRLLEQVDTGALFGFSGARIDITVLAFSLGLAAVSSALFGIAPAWQHARHGLGMSLARGGRGGVHGVRRGLRHTLVVAEVALTLVILVGAGLLIRSFAALQRVDTGVDGASVLTFQVSLPGTKYDSSHKVVAYHRDLASRIAMIAGVERAGIGYPLPMGGEGWSGSYFIPEPTAPELHGEYGVASPGYFASVGIALLAGRDFEATDIRDAPEVVIVDDVLARRHWGSPANAIGKMLNPNNNPGQFATIVGVVGHVRKSGPRNEGEPQIYHSMLRRPEWRVWYAVRVRGDAHEVVDHVRRAARGADANVALARIATMQEVIAHASARERFNMVALTAFGIAALLLAAVGLYGVMAYLVVQRLHEIGIRIALGAQPTHVLRLVVGEGVRMAIAGVAIGLVAAVVLSRSLRGLLFEVGETDVVTYAAVAALLTCVAVVASYLPARRATRVDPLVTLRG